MTPAAWLEEHGAGGWIFRPSVPAGFLVAICGRGAAPKREPSPTAFLARRFARSLAMDGLPIVRASQVHGCRAAIVRERPGQGEILDAGPCDILATNLSGVALVVQTADCVPVVLAGPGGVAIAHAGWRGSAKNAAAAAVVELSNLGLAPHDLHAWLGPSIGPCCYEVGGDVAARFAGEFVRRSADGRYVLDLPAVNRAQLEGAGVPPANISTHPACTRCGGEKFASYRRDGAASGRMIALVARLGAALPHVICQI